MKKILITGEDSYIGGMFTKWVAQWPDDYEVDEISVRGDEWKQADFSSYDTVFHVAGIAHVSSDPKMEDKYYQVNRDLTIEVAKKSKEDKVSQFVFMSSIIIYGTQNEFIDENTKPNPDNFYGESKLQAEKEIVHLQDEKFNIAIIRPPMIYGKGSKGNYQLLSKFARLTPIFPAFSNKRSMLHIDNLTEFIRLSIDNNIKGIFFPQNRDYVSTSEMVNEISKIHGKFIWMTELFNPVISLLLKVEIVSKVFGSFYYCKSISVYENIPYHLRDLKESVKRTEGY